MSSTSRSRRYRAVVAASSVLGFGAVATLALWSDAEFARGSFRSTGFSVESAATADGPFESHDSAADALSLDFNLPTEGLVENQLVQDEVWLRMGSEAAGAVRVLAPAMEQNEINGYIAVRVDIGACGSGGTPVQAGPLDALADATATLPLPGGTGESPGTAQALCIQANLQDTSDLPAGTYTTGPIRWEFVVTEETP